MANINKISVAGTIYDIQDQNASKTVELTQAEYDGLAVKKENTFYIISDAQGGDLSNYYTKQETDNVITAATSTKQDTLVSGTNIKTINNESILGEGNLDIQGGGGKAIEAGSNISIYHGETADAINCTLNLENNDGTNSIKMKGTYRSSGGDSFSIGCDGVRANGDGSFAGGSSSETNGVFSMTFGRYAQANNYGEVALGFCNQSNGSSSLLDIENSNSRSSVNTLFSVGNGMPPDLRHNAFEIRQNGDIYCSDGTNDVKLQDTITATAANTAALGGLKLVKLSERVRCLANQGCKHIVHNRKLILQT